MQKSPNLTTKSIFHRSSPETILQNILWRSIIFFFSLSHVGGFVSNDLYVSLVVRSRKQHLCWEWTNLDYKERKDGLRLPTPSVPFSTTDCPV